MVQIDKKDSRYDGINTQYEKLFKKITLKICVM